MLINVAGRRLLTGKMRASGNFPDENYLRGSVEHSVPTKSNITTKKVGWQQIFVQDTLHILSVYHQIRLI